MTYGLRKIKTILTESVRLPAGWFAFLFIITACSKVTPVEYSRFYDIPSDGMPQEMVYEFNPVPADSASIGKDLYDVVLTVRYNNRCRSSNVILDIEEISLENMRPDSTRIDIPLFDNEGKPAGSGNFGLFEISDTLRRAVPLQEGYSVSVSSPLPGEQTAGINAIGISAVPSGAVPFIRIPAIEL